MALPWMFTVAQGPAGGACPSPTNLPNMSGPKGRPPPTRTTVGRDALIPPHPAAPQTPRADMESAPTDKGKRRATAGTAHRPLTTPAPLHKGAFLSLFYKNTALYLSHLRGGAAIRKNFTTFRRRAGFSRQAIHGMIEPCIPLEGRGKEARFVAAIIRTVKLRKVYAVGKERVVALNDVDINIEKGEFCCIVGQSGSGKSTLLNQLAGLEKPTRGQVFIGKHEISAMNEDQLAHFRQAHLGFIFQSYNLLPSMTAAENVAIDIRIARQTAAGAGPQRAQEHGPGRPCQPPAHRDERRPAAARGHRARLCQPPPRSFLPTNRPATSIRPRPGRCCTAYWKCPSRTAPPS